MCRIGGRLRSGDASRRGAALEIPPLPVLRSNLVPSSGTGTMPDGQFDWGGRLLKGNGGIQRFPQRGRQSRVEHKGIRELDCEADTPSRYESRA